MSASLIVDSREPQRVLTLLNKKSIPYRLDTLNYGDYIILGKPSVVIERKNIFDLFNSLDDNRIWKQLRGLEKYIGYKKVLLIEGSVWQVISNKGKGKLNKGGIAARYIGRYYSTLAIITKQWDVQIVHVDTPSDSVHYISKLIEKVNSDEVAPYPILVSKNDRDINEEVRDIIGAIDGIGVKKREILLDKVKTIEDLVKLNEADLIKMVGDKLGKHIYEVLRYKVDSK
jgi:ERCC4-type nuclease